MSGTDGQRSGGSSKSMRSTARLRGRSFDFEAAPHLHVWSSLLQVNARRVDLPAEEQLAHLWRRDAVGQASDLHNMSKPRYEAGCKLLVEEQHTHTHNRKAAHVARNASGGPKRGRHGAQPANATPSPAGCLPTLTMDSISEAVRCERAVCRVPECTEAKHMTHWLLHE